METNLDTAPMSEITIKTTATHEALEEAVRKAVPTIDGWPIGRILDLVYHDAMRGRDIHLKPYADPRGGAWFDGRRLYDVAGDAGDAMSDYMSDNHTSRITDAVTIKVRTGDAADSPMVRSLLARKLEEGFRCNDAEVEQAAEIIGLETWRIYTKAGSKDGMAAGEWHALMILLANFLEDAGRLSRDEENRTIREFGADAAPGGGMTKALADKLAEGIRAMTTANAYGAKREVLHAYADFLWAAGKLSEHERDQAIAEFGSCLEVED